MRIITEFLANPPFRYFQIFRSLTASLINKTIKHVSFNENKLYATATIVCFMFLHSSVNADTNNSMFDIRHLYKTFEVNQRIVFNLEDDGEKLEAIVLLGSTRSTPITMSFIFQDDVCISKFSLLGGSGHAVPYFKCQSGAKIKTQFMCRSTCYVQARHSQKGSWAFNYKYKLNQNLPLDEILEFAGYTETASQQENSANQDVQKTPSTLDNASKMNKAKSTCTELGFTLGTEKHGDCVLKMMDN
jgi:hypothetical protein